MARKLKKSKGSLMSVTIRPGFATSGIAHLAAHTTKEMSMQLSIYAVWD